MTTRPNSFIVGQLLALLLFLLTGVHSSAQMPPNIILVLADDLGWGDLSCYQAAQPPTPHLDGMAAQGVRFSDFYSASPVCSPSRAALLTGRYAFRSGVTRVLFPKAKAGLPSTELTLAEVLRYQGYATGIVGKWHLGIQRSSLPLQQGFAHFFGIPYSHDMRPLVFMRGNETLEGDTPIPALLTRRYTLESIEFIRAHRDHPFFLLISHSMPHYPVDASLNWKGRNLNSIYRDAVQELDWSVGRLLETLRETGLRQKTAIFFTSDNGSWKPSGNGSLRGRKSSTWEGGVRVPLIAAYPGVFRQDSISDLPAMNFDLFATILDLLQIRLPAGHRLDGRTFLPALTDSPPSGFYLQRRPDDPLFYMHRRKIGAIRAGDWKLHLMRGDWRGRYRSIEPELYNLRQDLQESRDLAQAYPQRVEWLLGLAAGFRMEVREAKVEKSR